jgi:hypothetical protein
VWAALAVFSADGLSSVTYATEEILPVVVTNEPFKEYLHNGTAVPFYVDTRSQEGPAIAYRRVRGAIRPR